MLFFKKEHFKAPLQTIIEELKDGFCTIEPSGEFIYLNRVALDLFEISNGSEFKNFFNDVIREKKYIDDITLQLKESGFVKDYELEVYTTKNNKFPVLLSLSNIQDPHENIVGLSILIKDMTYIKKVQQQLLQAQKLESVGMLASGIAHEFNNILTGILPNAELIKMTSEPDNPNHHRANSIQKSALRASEIVKKLLSFSRHEKTEEEETSNFVNVTNETIDILSKLIERNISIKSSLPNDLFHVKIDSTRLQQIIMNLTINAKDAIKDRGEIKITAENFIINNASYNHNELRNGKYVLLKISDTGQGIPEENLGKIFDPFFTTKEPGKGTGLGLSIIYGIINNIKGKIEVHSKIGSGTTFCVYFPGTEIISDNGMSDFKIESSDKEKTILIIDDEPMIREMSRDMLTTLGYDILVANSGIDGIRLFKDNFKEIDLVLLDLLMPEMNGVTCFKKLKEINNQVKVIITSGLGELEQKKNLKELGIRGYLEKPYSLKIVAETIERVLA